MRIALLVNSLILFATPIVGLNTSLGAPATRLATKPNLFAPIAIPPQYEVAAEQHRNFLIGLGFEDYALQAKLNAEEYKLTQDVNPIVPPILEKSFLRMKSFSYAREAGVLAKVGLLRAKKENREKAALQKLLDLTAYHLLPFTLMGLEPVPESVFKFKVGKAAETLREEYLTERAVHRFATEKKAFIAAFLDILYSEQELKANSREIQSTIAGLDLMASEIFTPQYFVTSMTQNRFLGRALVATLLQHTRANGFPEIEENLRSKLAAEGQSLDNHITSTLTFTNRESKPVKIKVYSGDIANEYSAMSRSYQIASGVLPAPKNQKAAEKYNLIGNLTYFPYALGSQYSTAMKKKHSNMNLNADEKRALKEIWDVDINRGFSHAGLVEVKSDARSGISMVWIWDVYPRGTFGGVRLQTPENFANPERFNRIGFVHYDANKAFNVFRQQYQKRGYLSKVWESVEAILTADEDGDPDFEAHPKNHKEYWYANVPPETVQRWSQYNGEQASRWFQQEAVPRALSMVRSYLVGRDALGFASNFKNVSHTAYCTQLVLMSFLQGANFDMQSEPDVWRGVSKVAGKFGFLDVNVRIVAPSGFAWQTDLTSTVNIVDFDRSGVIEQEQSAPFLNGKPTVVQRRLQLLQPLLQSQTAKLIEASRLSPIERKKIDTEDEDPS